MNFAKLFQVEEDQQVLITLGYNEDSESCLNLETEVDGIGAKMSLGFNSHEDARKALNNIDEAGAKAFMLDMVKTVGQ